MMSKANGARRALPTPAPVRRRRSAADTRKLLLTAPRELVAKVGIRDAQMAINARHAEVAIGTVYRYFPSTSDLNEVVACVAQREIDIVAGIATAESGPAKSREEAIRVFAKRALAGRRVAHVLVAEPVDAEIDAMRLRHHRFAAPSN